MQVSVTRLRLAAWPRLPAFLYASEAAARQARKSAGFLGGRLLLDRRLTFWTLTAWTDADAMRAFRDRGAHRKMMPKLLSWCSEASLTHWSAPDGDLPPWDEAHRRLLQEGRASRVARPSPHHAKLEFAPPATDPWRTGRL